MICITITFTLTRKIENIDNENPKSSLKAVSHLHFLNTAAKEALHKVCSHLFLFTATKKIPQKAEAKVPFECLSVVKMHLFCYQHS